MPDLLAELWSKISSSDRFIFSYQKIPAERVKTSSDLNKSFEPDKYYFTVRVNEMFLKHDREWFSEYDPVVFVVTEFVYNKQKATVPFVVGPNLLQEELKKLDIGEMIFKNTTVAGTHPFKGDPFTIKVVLARIEKKDHLRDLLKLIESTASTYTGGFATAVNSYLKVSNVVLEGIRTLFGKKEVQGLIGHSNTIMLNAGDDFKPGYFVLINKSEDDILRDAMAAAKEFFVKDNSLYYGRSLSDCAPYREADYVLYSVLGTDTRKDIPTLPFYTQWEELLGYAMPLSKITPEQWELIKGKLFSLQSNMRLSPDLIREQVRDLFKEYKAEIDEIKNERENLSVDDEQVSMEVKDEWEKEMDEMALTILKM